MADTPDNQAEYPQRSSQARGCGFPIVRVVVLFALSTGIRYGKDDHSIKHVTPPLPGEHA